MTEKRKNIDTLGSVDLHHQTHLPECQNFFSNSGRLASNFYVSFKLQK